MTSLLLSWRWRLLNLLLQLLASFRYVLTKVTCQLNGNVHMPSHATRRVISTHLETTVPSLCCVLCQRWWRSSSARNMDTPWSTSSNFSSAVWCQARTLYIRCFDICLPMSCQLTQQQRRREARVVCLDINRAFWPCVAPWPGLLEKLSSLGFSGTLHALMTDYLKDRSLKVVLNGRESGVKRINDGVP